MESISIASAESVGDPSGILVISKPSGVTSHDVVSAVRRLFGTKRVGHTGTLDPMATGVLVVLVGRAAKAAEYLSSDEKRYRALLRLGITTDTEDVTGSVLSQSDSIPSPEQFFGVLDRFRGEILQTPPMYSALKVNGQKLCDLARRGVTVERTPRPITIYSLSASPCENACEYVLDVACSSGTYIRTLCADIGSALGCGGAMAELCRTRAGGFDISSSATLSELEAMSIEERIARLLPVEDLFLSLPRLTLSPFYERLIRNGCEVDQKKLGCRFDCGQRLRLCSSDGFFALGEAREQPSGGVAIKAIKTFELS